ncbi:MAG: serine/threonine-protein kinase [Kofleriaceae bacterium]
MDPLIGQTIDGRFEVRARLGQGGMGTVYRAYQRSVDREVAIKLMDPTFSRDPVAVRRFEREAQLASKLSQPNTVSVFDFGKASDGRLFIAMELIRGRTLHRIVQTEGAFEVERAARVAIQICDALDAAHRLGIVHRDLKLDNVMVLDEPPGRDLVKVLDFGLAKRVGELDPRATGNGIVVGTPRYIAPEVAVGGDMSSAADVYAVGVILAELVLGRPLWESNNLSELLVHKLAPLAVVADVPEPLRGLVIEMIASNPSERPSAAATRERLSLLHVSGPMRAHVPAALPEIPPTVEVDPRRRRRPRWRTPSLVLLGVVTGGAIVAGLILPASSSSPAPRDAAVTTTSVDPWNVQAGDPRSITMVIESEPAGVPVFVPGSDALGFHPTPVTIRVPATATSMTVVARWPHGRKPVETTNRLALAAGRHVLLHDPTHLEGRIVRHWQCMECGPERAAVIVHVTSTPAGLPVTVDNEHFAVATTPFDLYADLDAPAFTLTTRIGLDDVYLHVTPDRDQTVRLTTGERERSR